MQLGTSYEDLRQHLRGRPLRRRGLRPAGGRDLAEDGGGHRPGAARGRGGRRSRRGRRAAAFDDGEWPRWSPAERAAALRRLADHLDRRSDELAELGRGGERLPDRLLRGLHGDDALDQLQDVRRPLRDLPVRGGAPEPGGMLAGPARAGRRRRRDPAVQRAADAGHAEGGAGARGGLHGDPQGAGAERAGLLRLRGGRRGGRACRPGSSTSSSPTRRRASGSSPTRASTR